MQRGQHAGTAGAENEDIAGKFVEGKHGADVALEGETGTA
jgi:hypothetical protein